MALHNSSGGGSRAAKKRRKSSGNRDDDVNQELSNKGKIQEIAVVVNDKKKDSFSADSLSKTALELADASSIAALSSSSGPKAKSHDELLKLSLKEVLALEEITEVDCPSRGAAVLSIILSPYDRSTFYSDYWEKRPMHCACDLDKKRSVKGLLSSKQFRYILKSQSILYGLDVTTSKIKADYSTLTSDKLSSIQVDDEELVEAKESELLEHFRDRFSIRLLCPQKFHDPLWSMLSILEFEFGSRVGCRVDLLPSNGKGFKPRYDNFDSIIIQLEGKSTWKLYSCLEGFELPRCSSFEIEFDQLPSVVSVEATLNAGDSLYIPKGWTHRQENTTADASLFLTIQINEGNSIADLLETVMPEALSEAIEKKTDMRRSLPRSFHSFMGVASSENDSDPLRYFALP
jgi:Cupin superfamily protein